MRTCSVSFHAAWRVGTPPGVRVVASSRMLVASWSAASSRCTVCSGVAVAWAGAGALRDSVGCAAGVMRAAYAPPAAVPRMGSADASSFAWWANAGSWCATHCGSAPGISTWLLSGRLCKPMSARCLAWRVSTASQWACGVRMYMSSMYAHICTGMPSLVAQSSVACAARASAKQKAGAASQPPCTSPSVTVVERVVVGESGMWMVVSTSLQRLVRRRW